MSTRKTISLSLTRDETVTLGALAQNALTKEAVTAAFPNPDADRARRDYAEVGTALLDASTTALREFNKDEGAARGLSIDGLRRAGK